MIYCRPPSKVNTDYQTIDFELVHTGCSKTPPPLTAAEQARMVREAQEGVLIGPDDALLAEEQVSELGIDPTNLETEVSDSPEVTSEMDLNFEIRMEELRQINELARREQLERDRDAALRLAEQQSADTAAVRGWTTR